MAIKKVHKATAKFGSVNAFIHRRNIGIGPECMCSTEDGAFVMKQHRAGCLRIRTVIFYFPFPQDMNTVNKQHAKKNTHCDRTCKASGGRFCFDFHALNINYSECHPAYGHAR